MTGVMITATIKLTGNFVVACMVSLLRHSLTLTHSTSPALERWLGTKILASHTFTGKNYFFKLLRISCMHWYHTGWLHLGITPMSFLLLSGVCLIVFSSGTFPGNSRDNNYTLYHHSLSLKSIVYEYVHYIVIPVTLIGCQRLTKTILWPVICILIRILVENEYSITQIKFW